MHPEKTPACLRACLPASQSVNGSAGPLADPESNMSSGTIDEAKMGGGERLLLDRESELTSNTMTEAIRQGGNKESIRFSPRGTDGHRTSLPESRSSLVDILFSTI